MTAEEIRTALAAPFPAAEISFKPMIVRGERALAAAYLNARAVMDRLDSTVGIGNWEDSYYVTTDGGVVCRLKVKVGDAWVCKADVGSPSDQPDGGDRQKAAFSDALKRAAVKFGIGRYLYRVTSVWCDWDPAKRQFKGEPRLPAWALPTTDGLVAHGRALNAAKTIDELRLAFAAVQADTTLNPADIKHLVAVKNARKAALAEQKPTAVTA